jgi:hypothetical protein
MNAICRLDWRRSLQIFVTLFFALLLLHPPAAPAEESSSGGTSSTSEGSYSGDGTSTRSSLTLSPTSLALAPGKSATVTASHVSGTLRARSGNTAVATASVRNNVITVRAIGSGSTTIRISDSRTTRSLPVTVSQSQTLPLQITPTSVSVAVGATTTLTVSGAAGTVTAVVQNPAIATTSVSGATVTVRGVAAGSTSVVVSDGQRSVSAAVTVTGTAPPPPPPPPSGGGISTGGPGANYAVLAANDLGMHCTDKDFQIFSILPPFNTLHTQVIVKGATPSIATGSDVDVYYAATSSALDPAGAGSINTSSANTATVFKTNFWDLAAGNQTYGSLTYRTLYPAQACATPPCPSVLDLFSPIPGDVGLPVPDPNALPSLVPNQQSQGSILSLAPFSAGSYGTNTPQLVKRFDTDLAFFQSFPFGEQITGVNWFSADGIPMMPVDDVGRPNAYPLVRVAAVTKGASIATAGSVLAALDVVLPVASEADCQTCHASLSDAAQSTTTLTGRAAEFASVSAYANGTPWAIATTADAGVPGPEKLLNAAKINILRLHDAKHGAAYVRIDSGAADACLGGSEASCLDQRRTIQCSQCHYTPALDLAQIGPVDEPLAGRFGRQQTRHISMSSAMHGFHGKQTDASTGQYIFPDMPAPGSTARTPAVAGQVLNDSCYQCHPGKRTQCLRGAMATGGVVCQDCHGNMRQVGNDFTGAFPSSPGSADLSKRVPWANEPKCQSCHLGDAVTVQSINRSDMIVAADGIRLAQAYTKTAGIQPVLANILTPASRFAENNNLYRLSNGHGGVMCKACHGSTHSEWPVANPNANDNVAATQLQGHTGTVTECTVCHTGTLPRSLAGPHGMHPVNDSGFYDGGHENLAQQNLNACRACHGQTGQGTVLSRVAADRTLKGHALTKGTPVSCSLCHQSPL